MEWARGKTRKPEIAGVLRGFVGQYAVPVDTVSRHTGLSSRVIYSHVNTQEGSLPSVAQWESYIQEFGAAFLNAWLGPMGYVVRRVEPGPVCALEQLAGSGQLMATLSEALSDGRIDHLERARLIPLAERRAEQNSALAQGLRHNTVTVGRAA